MALPDRVLESIIFARALPLFGRRYHLERDRRRLVYGLKLASFRVRASSAIGHTRSGGAPARRLAAVELLKHPLGVQPNRGGHGKAKPWRSEVQGHLKFRRKPHWEITRLLAA
jgi:hypothetical protein